MRLPEVPSLASVKAEQAKRSLREYIRQAWPIVEPATPYVPNWHLDAISEHLEAASRGQIRNLIINIPPRHSKSLSVSVFWPTWAWITSPASRWMFASYAGQLAIRDSLKCRNVIQSPWYQRNWGQVYQLAGDQNLKSKFETNHRGFRFSTSVGGLVTGEGADFIVVDDPHNVKEADSEVIREGVINWWDQVMSTRGNDPKKVVRVVIMQRVHEGDLTGHLLAQGGWDHLCLPAEYEPTNRVTSIGFRDPRAEQGTLLWPERFGRPEVDSLKKQLGSYGTSGQLQQRPTPAEGGIFKQSWFKKYRVSPIAGAIYLDNKIVYPSDGVKFLTVDLAVSKKETADYTAILAWAYVNNELILLDVYRDRLEGPDIAPKILMMKEKHKADFAGIETVAFQLSVVQQARRAGIPVKELKPDRDKVSRAIAATPTIEAGNFWIPEHADWLDPYLHEMLSFPNGDHDDMVDATSYACNIGLGLRSVGAGSWSEEVVDERDSRPLPVKDEWYKDRISDVFKEW